MSLLQRVTGPAQPPDLKGKTALLVGATSGVGEALAHQLVESRATLVIAGRDQVKLDALVNTLRSRATAPVLTILADLADLNSIVRACQEVHGLVTDLDLLIASAGVLYMGTQRQLTRQGLELTMGVNHLGNAAVALATEDLLRAATRARVVIVASEAHRRAKGLPLDDLMGEHGFSGIRAYNRSKLANILVRTRAGKASQLIGCYGLFIPPRRRGYADADWTFRGTMVGTKAAAAGAHSAPHPCGSSKRNHESCC